MGRNAEFADTLDALPDSAGAAISGVERDPATGPDSSAG